MLNIVSATSLWSVVSYQLGFVIIPSREEARKHNFTKKKENNTKAKNLFRLNLPFLKMFCPN